MRRNKYNVAPKEARTIDGITFASKKEMNRYAELKMLATSGVISNLVLQPRFKLAGGITYVADFAYDMDGVAIVEDVKGVRTDVYKLKLKLFREAFPHLRHLES